MSGSDERLGDFGMSRHLEAHFEECGRNAVTLQHRADLRGIRRGGPVVEREGYHAVTRAVTGLRDVINVEGRPASGRRHIYESENGQHTDEKY
jgi:hypothetical protein